MKNCFQSEAFCFGTAAEVAVTGVGWRWKIGNTAVDENSGVG